MASRPAPPNPRGGKPRGTSRLTSRPSSPLWYGLAALLVLGLAQAYFMAPPGKSIPYSEFKQLVKNGEVAEIAIGEQSIRGTLKTGDVKTNGFTVTRVEDPKLTEELEAKGVKYTGEVMNRWLPELLGWVVPLLFLVGIWGFFFRRMSGAEGGVMSFARSKAKIYADDEVKVRFVDVAGVDVEVHPVLGDLRFGHLLEEQLGLSSGGVDQRDVAAGSARDGVAERGGPEPGE